MTIDPGSGQPVGGGQPPAPAEPQTSDRLRSMLAQAVEGQRDEQREVVGVLGDMRNQLLRLGQEIAEMRASGGADSADASTINNVTVELREAVRFLSERLDGVTRMVAQRGEELADIRGAMTAIDAHVRSQGETIGMLSQGLQALPSYGERVSAVQENVERVHQRLGEVQTAVARPSDTSRLDQRLASLEGTLAPITDHLVQSRQAAADHSATLAEVSATLAEQAAAMADHRGSLDGLHERVDSLAAGTQAALAVPPVFDDTAIQALDLRLTSIATEMNSLSRDVAGLVESGDGAGGPAAPVDTSEFAAAVTAAEERMRTHVDEAVLALAEMLLRRRMPAPSFDAIDTPEPPPTDPAPAVVVAAAVEDTASDDVEDTASDDVEDAASDDVEDTAAEGTTAEVADAPIAVAAVASDPADPGSDEPAWWEREQPDGEQPMVDFSAADITDEDVDAPPAQPFEADYLMSDEHSDNESGVVEDLDDTTEIAAVDLDAAPVAPAPVSPYESRPSAWSPEVPTERPEVDPAGTIVPERKKRWFRG